MIQKRPFNLLYKLNSQLSPLDRLTSYLLPLRIFLLIFMFLVLLVFGFRFFWDRELNNLIRQSNRNLKIIENEVDQYENDLFKFEKQIDLLKLYSQSNNSENKYFYFKKGDVLEKLIQIEKTHPNVYINSYSLALENNRSVVLISGSADSFDDIDKYVVAIKELDFVLNAFTPSQNVVKNKKPEFSLNIVLKDKLYEY